MWMRRNIFREECDKTKVFIKTSRRKRLGERQSTQQKTSSCVGDLRIVFMLLDCVSWAATLDKNEFESIIVCRAKKYITIEVIMKIEAKSMYGQRKITNAKTALPLISWPNSCIHRLYRPCSSARVVSATRRELHATWRDVCCNHLFEFG